MRRRTKDVPVSGSTKDGSQRYSSSSVCPFCKNAYSAISTVSTYHASELVRVKIREHDCR